MELRHLRYFIRAAEEQNITRAAGLLHVSQPALSRQIRDLEDELGIELLARTAKSVRLTEAGRVFLEEARAVVQRAADAVRAAQAMARGSKGSLQVGYSPSPTVEILPTILRSYQQAMPGVRVNLHDLTAEQILAGLRDNQLQAALTVRPHPDAFRGLRFDRLRRYRIGVCVPPGHRLARKDSVTVRDVLAEPIVAFSRADYPDYHCWASGVLGIREGRLRLAEECDGALSLVAAIESGQGIALALESLTVIAAGRIVFLPLKPAPAPAEVGILYRHNVESALAKGFVEIARRVCLER